ncbi:hypothetical protein LZ31DRAFT_552343 [Colletotrichum somersetense]|nr:hypothetical protein LZ31DRAFT_552343 [Colletotrichum somersetense]
MEVPVCSFSFLAPSFVGRGATGAENRAALRQTARLARLGLEFLNFDLFVAPSSLARSPIAHRCLSASSDKPILIVQRTPVVVVRDKRRSAASVAHHNGFVG